MRKLPSSNSRYLATVGWETPMELAKALMLSTLPFDEETRNMVNFNSAFQYAKSEFEKYHSPVVQSENEFYNFNLDQTTKEMTVDYLYALQEWAVSKFGSRKAAIEHFNAKGDTVTDKTFNNWKNKRSLKSKLE